MTPGQIIVFWLGCAIIGLAVGTVVGLVIHYGF